MDTSYLTSKPNSGSTTRGGTARHRLSGILSTDSESELTNSMRLGLKDRVNQLTPPIDDRKTPVVLEDDVLIEKAPSNVPCRFTVIGSPLIPDQGDSAGESDKSQQKVWLFYDPSDLIMGLQGMHHSEANPVWMDLVCDPETFVMISEHVRPPIHGLTIEDCVTPECREKLELFPDYLFCCVRTTSLEVEHLTEKLCILVFQTMIITYHNEPACKRVISRVRQRLEKRHQVLCEW